MCAGRSPFRAPNMMAVMNRICHESYRPLEEMNPNLPGELIDLVDRLLAKSPDDRFQDAQSVQMELSSLLSDFQSGRLRPRRAVEASLFDKTKAAFSGLFQYSPTLLKGALAIAALFLCILAGRHWFPKNDLADTPSPFESSPLNPEFIMQFRKLKRQDEEFTSAFKQADALLNQLESSDWEVGRRYDSVNLDQWQTELGVQSLERMFEEEDSRNRRFEEFIAKSKIENECADDSECTEPQEGDRDDN